MPTPPTQHYISRRKYKKIFWIGIFFANLIVIIVMWFNGSSHYYLTNPGGGNIWIAFGRLTGLLAEYAILLELILIGRITPIEQTFGFDKMNRLHQWVGYSLLPFLIIHPLFLVIGNAQANEISLLSQFGKYLSTKAEVFNAFVAVVIFGYVVFLSIATIRKKLRYEVWYFTHLLVYIAIALAFNHQILSGDMSQKPYLTYWLTLNFLVFGIMLTYRFFKPLFNAWRFQFRVSQVAMETNDTFSVYIIGKNIERFRYHAGQYANINFFQKNLRYTHPFSFSSEHNDSYIRFTIKGLGDYTKHIPELKPNTRVIIDGPLGLFVENVAERPKLLLIAGGIGVTPIRALIGDLVRKKGDIVLLYAARTVDDIAFRKEFDYIQSLSPFPIHYILGTPTPGYECGFLDHEKIVRLVPDFYDRDVFLCGPPPMMTATIKNLKELGITEPNVHYEKFSF